MGCRPGAGRGFVTNSAPPRTRRRSSARPRRPWASRGSIRLSYDGVAQNGNLGQNNNANQPWPMAGANDYVRAIDFNQPASRATWMNYAVPVTGGVATLTPGQQNITPQNMAWAQQLEIWITPWGFLKAAAANNATVHAQTVGGKRYQVVTFNAPMKSPGGQPYRMVGYINSQNLVEKVQTWLENPIFGDMLVEAEYTHYRDGANGLKFPAQMVQKRGGWPTFTAYILGAHANPPNIQQLLTPPPGGRGGGGGGRAALPRPWRRDIGEAGRWRLSAFTARTTPSPWSSRITSCSSSPDRKTKRARKR